MAATKDKGKEVKATEKTTTSMRTRRTATKKAAATQEVTSSDNTHTAVAEAPAVAQDEPKLCACKTNDGESCGRIAGTLGPINEDCFAEQKQAQGLVRCANFERCHEWSRPNWDSPGVRAKEDYGPKCREKMWARQNQTESQKLEESAAAARETCFYLIRSFKDQLPQVDFSEVERQRDEVNVVFAKGEDFAEAKKGFETAIEKTYRLVANHFSGQVTGLVADIQQIIDANSARSGADQVFERSVKAVSDHMFSISEMEDRGTSPKEFCFELRRICRELGILLEDTKNVAARFSGTRTFRDDQPQLDRKEQQRNQWRQNRHLTGSRPRNRGRDWDDDED